MLFIYGKLVSNRIDSRLASHASLWPLLRFCSFNLGARCLVELLHRVEMEWRFSLPLSAQKGIYVGHCWILYQRDALQWLLLRCWGFINQFSEVYTLKRGWSESILLILINLLILILSIEQVVLLELHVTLISCNQLWAQVFGQLVDFDHSLSRFHSSWV